MDYNDKFFNGIRRFHFRNMMHGYGPGIIPLKIARIYWTIATRRAIND